MSKKKMISLSAIVICLLLLLVISLWIKDRKADAACVALPTFQTFCRNTGPVMGNTDCYDPYSPDGCTCAVGSPHITGQVYNNKEWDRTCFICY